MKIRHGDTVVVISGKDKGKTGTVERVLKSDGRAIVGGINMRTRHIKKTTQAAGRKVRFEAAIDMSKLMIVDPKTQKPSRIGYLMKNGKKLRVSKASGTEIAKAAKADMKKKPKAAASKADDATKKNEVADTGDKKGPFWKRMKFGSAAIEQAEVSEQPHAQKDQSIPAQEIHVRKGSRGT